MYFEAYQKANLAAEKPVQTEYRVFAEITRELELASRDEATSIDRIKAAFRNSQLWLTLKVDLVSDQNQLDKETKAGLLALAIWIDKYNRGALTGKADLSPLIEINKYIMQGLSQANKTARATAPTAVRTAGAHIAA